MKNKKIFVGLALILGLVLCLIVGFFSNSKKGAKEANLSVAASVVEAYVEEEYKLQPFSVETNFNNQEKIIRVYILEDEMYNLMSTCSKEDFKNFIEYICEINLAAKKVANDLLNRNNINLSIRVVNDVNPNRYLMEVVNGKVEYSFRMDN